MSRNVITRRKPHILVTHDIGQRFGEMLVPKGLPYHERMHANRHHPGDLTALCMEHLKLIN
jgi:hypothetical protein